MAEPDSGLPLLDRLASGLLLIELRREVLTCTNAERLFQESTGLSAFAADKPLGLDLGFALRRHNDFNDFRQWPFTTGRLTEATLISPPLPDVIPKRLPAFVPYIYTRDELRRILQAFDAVCPSDSLLEPATARTIVLTLYGAGLRRQEAINLNRTDVNWSDSVLTIRDTKFLKTRLVPFGPQLGQALTAYSRTRCQTTEGPFFTSPTGERIAPHNLQRYFRLACERANVHRNDSSRFHPRLHDLRHTFAIHRLTSWYEQGADVQQLLSHLSTYLGHVGIQGTQTYLTMTPALLHEACQLFEKYAEGGTP